MTNCSRNVDDNQPCIRWHYQQDNDANGDSNTNVDNNSGDTNNDVNETNKNVAAILWSNLQRKQLDTFEIGFSFIHWQV